MTLQLEGTSVAVPYESVAKRMKRSSNNDHGDEAAEESSSSFLTEYSTKQTDEGNKILFLENLPHETSIESIVILFQQYFSEI